MFLNFGLRIKTNNTAKYCQRIDKRDYFTKSFRDADFPSFFTNSNVINENFWSSYVFDRQVKLSSFEFQKKSLKSYKEWDFGKSFFHANFDRDALKASIPNPQSELSFSS